MKLVYSLWIVHKHNSIRFQIKEQFPPRSIIGIQIGVCSDYRLIQIKSNKENKLKQRIELALEVEKFYRRNMNQRNVVAARQTLDCRVCLQMEKRSIRLLLFIDVDIVLKMRREQTRCEHQMRKIYCIGYSIEALSCQYKIN